MFSGDFRHMVFSALEGDGKMGISSEMVEKEVSEEDLADAMRPACLDGQGYSIVANGDFQRNYTLTYKKDGREIVFDVRRGEAASFLDTDRTKWDKAQVNGSMVYLCFEKKNAATLEMLMQGTIKCSISGPLTRDELIALAKNISV